MERTILLVTGRDQKSSPCARKVSVAEISAAGEGNIAMWIYSSDGDSDLLINEINQFEGSVRLPDCSDLCGIDVDGDMTYSLEVRS